MKRSAPHSYGTYRSCRHPRCLPWLRTVKAAVLLGMMTAAPAMAHVQLDAPNGGETLAPGSMFTIEWHDVVNHGPADYDLWYSTTGPDGPWIRIVLDLEPPAGSEIYTYQWTVPDTPSNQVRVRVQQDNVATTPYLDVSDSDLTIMTAAGGESVTLEPSRDATLYEGDGSLANGSGSYLFVGRAESQNNGQERRTVIGFELEGQIPQGATITAASLELTLSRTRSGPQTVALHRLLESWSEGPSDPPDQEGSGAATMTGDTTWVHRSAPGSLWTTAGGTFVETASAQQQVDANGSYTFGTTPVMAADVQAWLDDPASNHGWVLVMPSPPVGAAKRFDSRENASAAARPRLTIVYEDEQLPPTASFGFSPSSPRAGEVVRFTDSSAGPPSSWMWDFGDGETSDQQNPFHAFAAEGSYTVSLTVSNDLGSDNVSLGITVQPAGEPELTEMVLVSAAAHAEGDVGSFFVTTLDVHNSGSAVARYRLVWLPRDTDNSSPVRSAIFTLEPGETQRFADVLADVFGELDAVGALAVLSDSPDVAVMSRTFNPTDLGSFGQGIPGVSAGRLIPAGTRVRLLFLTSNADYRSNIGLVNGSSLPTVVQWELFARDGTSLRTGQRSLEAFANTQINRVLRDFAPIEAAYADVWTVTTGGLFTCYASILDELSSDPTTVLPLWDPAR